MHRVILRTMDRKVILEELLPLLPAGHRSEKGLTRTIVVLDAMVRRISAEASTVSSPARTPTKTSWATGQPKSQVMVVR